MRPRHDLDGKQRSGYRSGSRTDCSWPVKSQRWRIVALIASAREAVRVHQRRGDGMARHEMPPQGSEQDGTVELDAAGLAKLAREPEGGQHSAAEDAEDDPDETEE
jgi:hypothetical protein